MNDPQSEYTQAPASSSQVAANTAAITGLTARLDNRDQKDSVRAIALANVASLSGAQTIDGVALVAPNRIALAGQTAPQDNGLYVVGTPWIRATDADTSAKVTSGMYFFVEESGTTNAGKAFELTTPNPITLGTTPLAFQHFGGALKTSEIVNDSTVTGVKDSDALNTLNAGKVDKLTASKTIADAPYAFLIGDADLDILCPFTVDRVITIPLNVSVAFPVGQWLTGKQGGVGRAQFVATSGNLTSYASLFTRTAGSPWALYQRAADVWELYGDLY